jgi:hypothetical protein
MFFGPWPSTIAIIIAVGMVVVSVSRDKQRNKSSEKHKRDLESQDTYTLIDELDYQGNPEPDVADSLGELLDQRDDARRTGQR